MFVELIEGGKKASAGLGGLHRLRHVPLVDEDLGAAVSEVDERAGRVGRLPGVTPNADPGLCAGSARVLRARLLTVK